MLPSDRLLGVYLHLARASDLRRRPMVRDKLLVLAGVIASEIGLDTISALCRHRILKHNSWHIVGRWPSIDAALADERFQVYLKQLRRRYAPEKAEYMLSSLGIELAREQDAYFNLHEYAAALLGAKPEALAAILAEDPAAVRQDAAQPASAVADSEALSRARRRVMLSGLMAWGPFALGVVILLALGLIEWLLSPG